MTGRPAVLFATPYFPPHVGGVENYVWHLARLLRSRHGWRVAVATTAARGTRHGRQDGPDGIPVYRVPAPLRLSHTPIGPRWRRDLRAVLERERVDLVNGHAPVPVFADAAARACGELPFVLTYHTGRMRKGDVPRDALLAAYERTVLAGTARRADALVCSSDYVAADLPDLFAGRATTISPGADLARFAASPVPAAPRVLFVGSLAHATAYKGVPDLLRAVELLARTVPDAHLEVVGSGSAAGEYEALAARLGIARHVTFAGRLDGADLAAAYRRARVLALPTHYDSFPSVLVEAMAAGRPVVTTPVGGIPSLVRDGRTGLLVTPGDVAGLAAALGSVLADDALAARLGAAGRGLVAEELSWERQSDRTAEVFERALAARRGGPRTRTVAVVAPYYPPKVGGVEGYAARVARAVADEPGLRAVVLTTNTAGRRTTLGTDDGVPVVRLGTWARLSNTPLSPLWPLQVRHWLRRLDVDLVNAHAPVPGLGDVAVAAAGRRPAVLTYHSGSMRKGRTGSPGGAHRAADLLIRGYERWVLPRLFARASALVAVSPASLAAGRPGAVRITPGVDVERFTPGAPASTRPRTVVYVGRLDRTSSWKGVDVLLRAFAALAGDLPDARLRLVGGGDAAADHAGLAARLGVADRVELCGELAGEALVDALRTAAVLALPSRSEAESFGMALVEAMACGTPVVGSRVGGIPHVVDDGVTGLLVPPGDPAALAAACRRLLTDGGLADRLGAAGRERAVERYAWPGLTDRYLRMFHALLRTPEFKPLNSAEDGGQPPSAATAPRSAVRAGLALPSKRRRP
ncbi:glycosyltransferase [Streptomyces sp. B1866]|uniref:glycosyltransferase family 4 protein n=1 Tax=Streptomyces sp. B1866 TaxID=3075431 RepID=UPI0028917B1E|nr:glycosyltransferase [Streptomyces sp. B1866]MDT3395196.1 glycosyltransferase [Streptomyces sp. B1866]